jgi:hypothetical protein
MPWQRRLEAMANLDELRRAFVASPTGPAPFTREFRDVLAAWRIAA